jgi:Ca-activated chloride channel family protein
MSARSHLVPVAAAALLVAITWTVEAQFTGGVTLVEVYATVHDARGALVTDLQQRDFQVFEDGVPQRIEAFTAGDMPLAVAIAVDRSTSMAGPRLGLATAAAREFLLRLRPADRAMVIAISGRVEVVAPLSADRQPALAALSRLDAWSTTSLNDAIIACIDAIQPASGRRAAILLSDGIDRYSAATTAAVLERARRADVLVYPIALADNRPPLFAELATLTGGRSFLVHDPKKVSDTLAGVAEELRHQYLLGYSPQRPVNRAKPGWRSIDVKVNRPQVHVRARDGYFAE